jgi:hypothetical protein
MSANGWRAARFLLLVGEGEAGDGCRISELHLYLVAVVFKSKIENVFNWVKIRVSNQASNKHQLGT